MGKYFVSLLLALLVFCAASVTAFAADTATLTLSPDRTDLTADGQQLRVTYTVTVTPPEGKEIGVFSFRLLPSANMTLPEEYFDGDQQVIDLPETGLRYNSGSGKGVFQTYEYTPQSSFFAAVGSKEGRRMTEEAAVLTVTATLPADASGAYVLDAEFTAAPDGSGETYVGRVVSPPVTVTNPNAAAPQSGADTVVISELDSPAAGEEPDSDVTATAPGITPAAVTEWYCDGAPMTGGQFRPGHVYTVVITVEADAEFPQQVYTNNGYTAERLADGRLQLKRSYYVEQTFTQELTETEAQQRLDALTSAPQGDAGGAPSQSVSAPEKPEKPESRTAVPLIVLAAAAAAAVALQFVLPGGWKGLLHRRPKAGIGSEPGEADEDPF